MEERRSADLYRRAEQQLTAVASAVQQEEEIDFQGLSDLATAIAEAVNHDDQLVVHALAGPNGPPLVTNLINVAILSAKVSLSLGYYGEELQRLVLAGLVHDIGLFAVPQSLLSKSGLLTSDERTLIEQHPELGYQVVHKAGASWDWLANVVRQAHERWNGQGYPNKLKGRAISELAQIIGVVDVFDALVTPRSYRRRFFPHEAVRELIVAERMTFPREIIKALVEQLSAFPLGTLVRLTTGEVGTVIRINTEFPLRPVVEVSRDTGQQSGAESRVLDLGLLPLVSVIETLEPPDVARVAFPPGRPVERRSKNVPSVSDQFSSLLESLDAVASAIQGMVASRTAIPNEGGSHTRQSDSGYSAASESADIPFEKEVIGLFALEAHEWLAQIHSSLKQLGRGVNSTVRPKLYGIMLQGLTNLAKSAATIQQPAIENMASSLLPILHDVGKKDPRTMAAAVGSLQAGLDRLAETVRFAAGEKEAQLSASSASQREAGEQQAVDDDFTEPLNEAASDEPIASAAPVPAVTGDSLLTALRELHQVRARSMQPTRDILESVISRAEQRSGELTVRDVRDILDELDHVDEAFLEDVHSRVPFISRTLIDLQQDATGDFVTSSQLDPIIEQVEALYDAASRVQAGMISMLLQGLRSFLLVAAYRKTASLAQRLEAVQGRIQALIPMAEQWVTIGRVERAAIADILP